MFGWIKTNPDGIALLMPWT